MLIEKSMFNVYIIYQYKIVCIWKHFIIFYMRVTGCECSELYSCY